MAQIREIKQRMVAVGTIQRITKTMQMIATAKFTAAVQRTKATQPYTEKIRELVAAVCSDPSELDQNWTVFIAFWSSLWSEPELKSAPEPEPDEARSW